MLWKTTRLSFVKLLNRFLAECNCWLKFFSSCRWFYNGRYLFLKSYFHVYSFCSLITHSAAVLTMSALRDVCIRYGGRHVSNVWNGAACQTLFWEQWLHSKAAVDIADVEGYVSHLIFVFIASGSHRRCHKSEQVPLYCCICLTGPISLCLDSFLYCVLLCVVYMLRFVTRWGGPGGIEAYP